MKEKTRVLITGVAGFVGSNVLAYLLENTDWEFVGIASWKHRGVPERLLKNESYQKHKERVIILTHDLVAPFTPDVKEQIGRPDIILNIASDSHVDRSITDPVTFVQNNVNLTLTMLELAREVKPQVFLQFSTDEVYGQAPQGVDHVEWSPIIPSNPYSASKAAQEAIAISYWRTYGVPLIITNTMNVFGFNQDKEKFIPLCIEKIKRGEKLTIHGYPDKKTAGSRFYIHTTNVADALLFILRKNAVPILYPQADIPARYNIVGEVEMDNLTLAETIAGMLGKDLAYELTDFHSARPGHDCRYALDGAKLRLEGWKPKVAFYESLRQIVHGS
jgi:dTDP-glucose 4,6-dehydratase